MITPEEVYNSIEKLSELRSKYSCFDEKEEPFYRALSLGIKGIEALEQGPKTESVTEFADRCRECGKMRTARWIEENINEWSRKVFCSECGCPPPFEHVNSGNVYSANGYGVINKTKFCPNCGRRMVNSQKSEGIVIDSEKGHLHYIYTGDAKRLDQLYGEDKE